MRILYYMPQKFESGSDHLWEIQVSDNMGLRSPWRYGVPSDGKFADKAAIGLSLMATSLIKNSRPLRWRSTYT